MILGLDDSGPADTILRIAVDHKNLILSPPRSASMKKFLNPFLSVSLRLRVSLERRSDLRLLYDETFRFGSSALNFEQWSLNDGEQVRLAIVEGRRWLAGQVSSIVLKPPLKAPGRPADEKD